MQDFARFYMLDGQYIGAFAGGAQPPQGATEVPEPVDIMPTLEQLAVAALGQRDELLASAAVRIAPLQDAVDLGVATDAKVELLKEWKLYRIALSDVSEQEGFPGAITWPEAPART